MKYWELHSWQLSVSEAVVVQKNLSPLVSQCDFTGDVQYIAGVDVSVNRWDKKGTAAIVVVEYPSFKVVEVTTASGGIAFPYVPGLLSFRECPLVLEACERLTVVPDIFMVDGQGIAHPRRFGIASHLGLLLDKPTIGCAKSRLCGTHEGPGVGAGSSAVLFDANEVIGAVLRTRHAVKPLYISVGHKISLEAAMSWVLACCRGFRLPEPTRLAHQAAGGNLNLTPTIHV